MEMDLAIKYLMWIAVFILAASAIYFLFKQLGAM